MTLLSRLTAAEHNRFILWSPMGMMLGIYAYFSLTDEPSLYIGPALLAAALLLLAFTWQSKARALTWALLLIALGFSAASLRTHMVQTPLLTEELPYRVVSGTVDEIIQGEEKTKIALSQLIIGDLAEENTPRRVRITFRNSDPTLQIGDRVILDASLYPLPEPVMPGSYDFARHFYFLGIGGNGFAFHEPSVIEEGQRPGAVEWLNRLRHRIGEDMRATLPGATGAIAAAMTVGEMGSIPEEAKISLRDSGLAHILSISGLHLAIAAGLMFLCVRLLLTLYPPLALRLPVKKISACFALFGALVYLLLAGYPVPAIRAFIMVAFLFLAMLFDRLGITLRTLMIAAMCILLVFPEAMFGASFQMSFAATLAIVSLYERFRHKLHYPGASWWRRIGHHGFNIAVTSLAATLATAPFVIYNFNRFAIFGLISNMLVIPLATFLIMPGIVLSLILMPFGLQGAGYALLGYGIDLMLAVSGWVTHLPYAALQLPSPTEAGFMLCVFGLLWLCLMTMRWRLLGIPAIALGLSTMLLHVSPDLLVSANGKQVMARLESGQYVMLKGAARSFVTQSWLRSEGQTTTVPLKQSGVECSKELCVFEKNGQRLLVVRSKDEASAASACKENVALVVGWHDLHSDNCRASQLIGQRELGQYGAHALWLEPGGIRMERAREKRSNRPWHIHLGTLETMD